ncbi:MAG: hypothetical protein LBC39_03695 [Methanobrevibacter sp.]|jgi:hypothetical protein|nr:hypothetical protein [Candidatus Methanovirga aequatorialis]
MSKKNGSIIKGTIFLFLGAVVTYEMVVLHIKDIFIYLGLMVIGFGVCLVFTGLFKGNINRKYPHATFNRYPRNLEHISPKKENNSNENDILDKVQMDNEKSSSKPKMNVRFPKFSRSKAINKSRLHRSSNNKSNLSNSKLNLFNNSKIKPQKFKSQRISTPFVFTPNYERPSSITRKPVKKNLDSFKTRKLSKIKPTIPINQLSKTLGLEKKEDVELIKLKKMLADGNSENDSNLNNPNELIPDPIQNVGTLDHSTSKNTSLNRPTPRNYNLNRSSGMDDHNGSNIPKNNDLVNEEILNEMIREDLKKKDGHQNFMDELNETHVLCGDKCLRFNEALEKLSKEVKKEIAIEIPSLKSLSNKFLFTLDYLSARIVVEKFDVKDISYSFIVSSLLKNKNISIKTVDTVDSINVIVDDDYALVLSEPLNSGLGIGAIFNEKREIDSVKDGFDLLWKISEEL